MSFLVINAVSVLALLLAMIGMYLLGQKLAQRLRPTDEEKGGSASETAVFSMLGLLLGFTFFGAASRLEDRRHLVTQEANDIGTAWLRLDVLAPQAQPQLRQLFRDYTSARIAAFRDVEDLQATCVALEQSAKLQSQIWAAAVVAVRSPDAAPQSAMLLLPALNAMIDITTTRTASTENHPPQIVYYMLGCFGLIAALLTGYNTRTMGPRAWFNISLFSVVVAMTLAVILDLEYPRRGLIRVDAIDQVLLDVRSAMDR